MSVNNISDQFRIGDEPAKAISNSYSDSEACTVPFQCKDG